MLLLKASTLSVVTSKQWQTMLIWSVLLVLTATALSACGWRLRGASNMELELPAVWLQYQSASAVLQRDLNKALQSSGVELTSSEAQAGLKLIVHSDSQGRRVLSVGSGGKVNEYELQYLLNFSIRDSEDTLLVKDAIEQQRDYTFDETQVLAKDEEERQLYDFMRRSAVQSLLRRLQNVATQSSVTTEGGAVDAN